MIQKPEGQKGNMKMKRRNHENVNVISLDNCLTLMSITSFLSNHGSCYISSTCQICILYEEVHESSSFIG